MDVAKWMRGEYEIDEKEIVVAWYRINGAIAAHSSEAQSDAMKVRSK